jgi:hypothetical protein
MTTDFDAEAAVCIADAAPVELPMLTWDGKYFSMTFVLMVIPLVAMNKFGSLNVTRTLSGILNKLRFNLKQLKLTAF